MSVPIVLILGLLASATLATEFRAEDGSETSPTGSPSSIQMLQAEFGSWIKAHSRSYASPAEFEHRFRIFADNKKIVDAHNRQGHSYLMGLNQFSDLSDNEVIALLGGDPSTKTRRSRFRSWVFQTADFVAKWIQSFIPFPVSKTKAQVRLTARSYDDLPLKKKDWVADGALNDVRNQGPCGACYTFGTVAAIEAAFFIKNGKKIQLSEQHMINCGHESELQLYGCGGGRKGFGDYAVKYGFMEASEFPYFGIEKECKWKHDPVVKAKSFVRIPQNNFEMLDELIKGPIGTAILFDPNVFRYENGVFDCAYPIGLSMNHYVTIVGFDLTANPPYIKIRNSHGSGWGENGYMRMRLGGPEDVPIAGLGMEAFRPVLGD